MRLDYPANVKVIRVPCTGKVDILHILRAFEKGADGVCAIGCIEGDCHFSAGNLRARKRIEQARKILETIGIGGDRVRMFNLSSAEGPLFAQFAREITDIVKKLGPNPLKIARQEAA